jgi:hypothetical protein
LKAIIGGFLAALLVALLTLVGLALLSQVQQSYTFDMDGSREVGYLSGIHAVERNESFTYRWTTGESTLKVPNLPRQAMRLTLKFAGPGLDVTPVREASLWTDKGLLASFAVEPGLHEVSLVVPEDAVVDGALNLGIRVNPFSTRTDPRKLGLALVSVRLDPEGPLGELPWRYLLLSSASVGLTVLAAMVCGVGVPTALVLGATLGIAALLLQAFDRPALGLFGSAGLQVPVSALLAASLGSLLLRRWKGYRQMAVRHEASWMLLASVLALMALLLGVTYPQFRTSDLMMHVHNLEGILRGELFFTEPLPGGKPAPYPPAYYLVLVPFSLVYSDLPRLILFFSSMLTASSVCLMWIASRISFGTGWPGIVGGWLYALSPANFLLMSAGNHTNVFGQWVALVVFVVLLALGPAELYRRVVYWMVLTILLLAGFLSHLGVAEALMICLGLYIGGLIVIEGPWRRREVAALVAAIAGAALAAVFCYYLRFTEVLANLGSYVASGEGAKAARVPRREIPLRLLGNLWSSAGGGSVLGGTWGMTAVAGVGVGGHRMLVMAAWILGGLIYGVGNILTRTQGRNSLFVLAPLALAVGLILNGWTRRGWAGFVAAASILGVGTWFGLYDWALKVLYAYH